MYLLIMISEEFLLRMFHGKVITNSFYIPEVSNDFEFFSRKRVGWNYGTEKGSLILELEFKKKQLVGNLSFKEIFLVFLIR